MFTLVPIHTLVKLDLNRNNFPVSLLLSRVAVSPVSTVLQFLYVLYSLLFLILVAKSYRAFLTLSACFGFLFLRCSGYFFFIRSCRIGNYSCVMLPTCVFTHAKDYENVSKESVLKSRTRNYLLFFLYIYLYSKKFCLNAPLRGKSIQKLAKLFLSQPFWILTKTQNFFCFYTQNLCDI